MATVTSNRIISGSIPNFINGVSQQPFALRLASQAEEQVNAYSSVVEGLTKRPPTRHVAKLLASLPDNAFIHIINRDLTEKYVVVVTPDGVLKVFDFNGVQKTVNNPNGWSYLVSSTANLRAITIADYTFILNRDVVTAMTSETQPVRNPEGIVYVRQGNYATAYTVVVGGLTFTHTTGSTNAVDIQTDNIAIALVSLMTANATFNSLYNVSRMSSTLWITSKTNAQFTLRVADTMGDTAMLAVKEKTQSFVNLPARAVVGFNAEIAGSAGNDYDNYYVQYTSATGMDASWGGVWKEIAKPGRNIALNAATMPHILVRESNGTFTFKQATWDKCQAGDINTAPQPSFIGKKMADMFFFRNRLGFIADENVVMSRNAGFFNFWRTTATALLDTDPIDVAVSHVKVSILRHAIPFNESLLLFSDQTQFKLTGGDTLSPATVSVTQTTEFETANTAKPVGAGKFVFFGTHKGGYAGVREYFVDATAEVNDANDVTAHVPKYIKGKAKKFAASTNEDALLVITDEDPQSIYVYKYYYSGSEKVQSSWSRWEFPACTKVVDMAFVEGTCWMILKRPDGLYLERIDLAPGITDVGMDYLLHLDHRFTSDMVTAVVTTDTSGTTTTIPLPYTMTGLQVVALPGDATYKPGQVVPILSSTPTSVTVRGEVTTFVVGLPYTMRFLFSPLILRSTAPGGGQMARTEGRVQVRRMLVNYAESGYFRFEVTPTNRTTYTNVFTGRVLGSSKNRLGLPALETGSFRFPIMANNMQVEMELINDTPFPSRILNADWEAMYTVRTVPM